MYEELYEHAKRLEEEKIKKQDPVLKRQKMTGLDEGKFWRESKRARGPSTYIPLMDQCSLRKLLSSITTIFSIFQTDQTGPSVPLSS
jgi:hypothetical protein